MAVDVAENTEIIDALNWLIWSLRVKLVKNQLTEEQVKLLEHDIESLKNLRESAWRLQQILDDYRTRVISR